MAPALSAKTDYVCPTPCLCEYADLPSSPPSLVVDCRRRQLTAPPPLDGLHGVVIYRLYLDRNQITSLPDHAFSGLTVHGIQLADNPLVNISASAFTGTTGLRYLSLRRTLLTTAPSVFSAPLRDLQVLDVSHIRTPTFTHLPAAALGTLPALEQLLLKQNQMSGMAEDALSGVEGLEELHLEANGLEAIPAALRALPALRSLHLDSNPLTGLADDALVGMTRLETLTLTDTQMTSVENMAPDALTGVRHSLQRMDLSINQLGAAPCSLLAHLTRLTELRLADAMLTDLPPGCFSGLSSLRLLDLSGNKVTLGPGTLDGLEASLKVLLLERLDLTLDTLPLEALRTLPVLRELSLSGNSLPVLPDRAFAGLAVTKLALNYCQVTTIDPLAFDGLKAPFVLDLNNNQLTNLTFLNNKCQFESVELYRNPIRCDCAFYHVVRYGITSFVGQCAAPAQYRGVKLADFKSHENVTSECGTLSGVNDTILCFWQYLTADDPTSGQAAPTRAWGLLLVSTLVLYARVVY